ncbi:hypothetical protein AA0229_0458 [Gluconobacter cerinus NRIC 0229]|nr:hypothetical protein AA0229_0458 [Gluconobacter cerinus NRIC 0229]
MTGSPVSGNGQSHQQRNREDFEARPSMEGSCPTLGNLKHCQTNPESSIVDNGQLKCQLTQRTLRRIKLTHHADQNGQSTDGNAQADRRCGDPRLCMWRMPSGKWQKKFVGEYGSHQKRTTQRNGRTR